MGCPNLCDVAGQGGHWASNKGTFDKPGLLEKDAVFSIDGQEGRRFWGVLTHSGNGETTSEPFIGQLYGKDNHKVLMVDTEGQYQGEIAGDELTHCYSQASGPTNTSVVGCATVKRQR